MKKYKLKTAWNILLLFFSIFVFIFLCVELYNKNKIVEELKNKNNNNSIEYIQETLNKGKYYSKMKNEISVFSISDNTFCVKTYLWIYEENDKLVSLEAGEFNVVKESVVDEEQRRQIRLIQEKQKEVDRILEERYKQKNNDYKNRL